MPVEGIDVSKWQPEIDWVAAARAGIYFVFIKGSEGTYADAKFIQHWEGSKGLMLRGAYVFFRPDLADQVSIATQMRTLYRVVSDTGDLGELPPVLDVEKAPCTWSQVAEAMDLLESLFGRTPILYTSPGFARYLGPLPAHLRAKNWPLWIAQYTQAAEPTLPNGWTTWTFWQYTSQGRIPGYTSNIDRDRFNGTLEDLFRFAGMPLDRAAWWRVNRLERLTLGVAPGTDTGGQGGTPQGTPYRVTAVSLRVRRGPGIQYPVVGGLRRGQIVYVVEVSDYGQPYAPWGRIGENQWISLRFAEKVQ